MFEKVQSNSKPLEDIWLDEEWEWPGCYAIISYTAVTHLIFPICILHVAVFLAFILHPIFYSQLLETPTLFNVVNCLVFSLHLCFMLLCFYSTLLQKYKPYTELNVSTWLLICFSRHNKSFLEGKCGLYKTFKMMTHIFAGLFLISMD